MSVVLIFAAIAFLMAVAYRGQSVILFAPVAALGVVLLTDPSLVAPTFTGVFMDRMADFLKLYLPVFLLGAVFGKLMELAGFAQAVVCSVLRGAGGAVAIPSVVAACALLTYGGVSLFVVVFAIHPFALEVFRRSNIPRRLIPAAVALGAFSFTMDALPGTPQIQNLIPGKFFKTDVYAAPWLGVIGGAFILTTGLFYLEWRRRRSAARGEGFSDDGPVEQEPIVRQKAANPFVAILPLVLVGLVNRLLTTAIPRWYGDTVSLTPASSSLSAPLTQDIAKVTAIWAIEGALLVGIVAVIVFAWKSVVPRFAQASKTAVAGALLAAANTASEYGFGAVIAAQAGFLVVANALSTIPDPLLKVAVIVTSLAGITGSASGGLSVALAAMSETFLQDAHAANIPPEVLHRVAAMASGGMDTLPHNGAVITLLTVTGLTHRQAYGDIFAITCIKTLAVLVVIAAYWLAGVV